MALSGPEDGGKTNGGWDTESKKLDLTDFDVDVQKTINPLLAQEDTNHNGQITVEDHGPKRFRFLTLDNSEIEITGTYQLSNLLQELTLAANAGRVTSRISASRISENPVDRLNRMICGTFWDSLTRRLDDSNIKAVTLDIKANSGKQSRIYIPHELQAQYEYYQSVSQRNPDLQLDVVKLPKDLGHVEKELREKPGLLALDMQPYGSDHVLRGVEYVVPGGRFNEFYYWDSYFSAIGLLEAGKVELACSITDNMIFEIEHYGLAPNANRSYYLQRSQPPFLTDLVIRTYRALSSIESPKAEEFLRQGIIAAIKEYHNVWMSQPRLDPVTDLSRYRPGGEAIPPEVEPGHFDWFLRSSADKEGMSIPELCQAYNTGHYKSTEMDDFFGHDRAVRESGHDTSYRLEGQAADLATIDLNSLLYKYETDIAWAIKHKFSDALEIPPGVIPYISHPTISRSSYWNDKAISRRYLATKYLWSNRTGMFHDYNTASHAQTPYQSITTFYSLWSGLATPEQASSLVKHILPKFEYIGGAVSTLPNPDHRDREIPRRHQWDYPFGWAPHQMLLWDGLKKYGFFNDAKRLAYKWLYLLTRIAVDYNGRITERYDVTRLGRTNETDGMEYGNQGTSFEGVNVEGFGWTNASYQYGLVVIGEELGEMLRNGVPWEEVEKMGFGGKG